MKSITPVLLLVFLILFSCRKEDIPFIPGDNDTNTVEDPRIKVQNIKRFLVPETVNSFPGHWCCASGNYLYGTDTKDLTSVLRKTEDGQTVETRGSVTSVDPSYIIDFKMYALSEPGILLVLVRNDQMEYSFLKSSDGAATFKKVFTFGEGNGPGGTNVQDVRILRGILELKRDVPGGGDKGVIYLPEYNVSKGRIPGSTNDRIRIMRSSDQGDTWTKVVEWNTNGVNQAGHIHAMKQDPYTGEIYICMGDSNDRSGIIIWDGKSDWKDNSTMAELSRRPGFTVLTGLQRYRVCDVLFDENYFYTFTDTQLPNNSSGTESGIWRGTKNFSVYTRVDNSLFDYDPMHIGWFGEKINNTFIFTTSREYSNPTYSWKELNTRVYTSTNGTEWHATGVIDWRDNAALNRYINNMFTFNDRLYIDCVGGAGHSSTIQCILNKEWRKYDDPVILHPVYFVGKWNAPGNDQNSGTNADAPKLTLKSMLENRSISAGARVKLSEGEFPEDAIYPFWATTAVQGRGSVVIEGMGMNKTSVISSARQGNYGITLEAARTLSGKESPLILRDLEFYMTYAGGTEHDRFLFNIIDSYISTWQCRIGHTRNDLSPLVHLASAGAGFSSGNSYLVANAGPGSSGKIIEAAAANSVLKLKNCILLNGSDAIDIGNDAAVDIKNCTFYGTERHGIIFSAACSLQPVINNCIFRCGSFPITDFSGMTETGIDYNIYNRSNLNIDGGSHSLISSINPLISEVADSDHNFKIRFTYHAYGKYLPDVPYDFIWRERNNPPSIGAYE